VGWTIFTVIDLSVGLLLIDLISTTVPPEKLQRVRTVRNVTIGLLAVLVIVLVAQIVHRHTAH